MAFLLTAAVAEGSAPDLPPRPPGEVDGITLDLASHLDHQWDATVPTPIDADCLPCYDDWGWFPRGHQYDRAMARTPDMLGDFFSGETIFVQTNPVVSNFVRGDLPLAGGTRNVKVAEHNRALPTDRVYFLYHHFHRALRFFRSTDENSPPFQSHEHSIDRYTAGLEKTFLDDAWSVEVRMAMTDQFEYRDANPQLPNVIDFEVTGGEVGNLAVILKRLLYLNDFFALCGGVGLNTPTGDDVVGRLPAQFPAIDFTIFNESLHVLPFLGFTGTEGDRWFMHAFVQFDVAASGDRVVMTNANGNREERTWHDPTLFYFDIGFGYWLHHAPRDDGFLTGIAGLLEYHYAAPIHGNDEVALFNAGFLRTPNDFENIGNVAAGIHLELSPRSSLRGALVVPLESFPNRTFDAEGQASFIRRF